MLDLSKVESYSKCECGAWTFFLKNDRSISCHYQWFTVGLGIEFHNVVQYIHEHNIEELPTTYCCDHCVNHYGVDLCACGSGERVGECENGFDCCNKPLQTLDGGMPYAEGWL